MMLIPLRKPVFVVFVILLSEKRPEFLVRTFVLDFAIDSSKIRPEFLVKTFLFWSAEMVAACCNLVRTKYGPVVQKVADSCIIGLTIKFRSWLSNLSRLSMTKKSFTRSGFDDEERNLAHVGTMYGAPFVYPNLCNVFLRT